MDRNEWRRLQVEAARRAVGDPGELPAIELHPDPLRTRSVVVSQETCECCHRGRGYLYAGPINRRGGDAGARSLCPWCIVDGSAARTFEVTFNELDFSCEPVPVGVRELVEQRTPGFFTWQGDRWMTHCGDAAVFLGPGGGEEVRAVPGALESLLDDDLGWGEELLDRLSARGDATAYVFCCRVCGTGLAFWDAS